MLELYHVKCIKIKIANVSITSVYIFLYAYISGYAYRIELIKTWKYMYAYLCINLYLCIFMYKEYMHKKKNAQGCGYLRYIL